jgi:hypothetical protein
MPPASRHQSAAGNEGRGPAEEALREVPLGYVDVDIAQVRTEEDRLHLFVAIDRTSEVAYAELHERATQRVAGVFLRAAIVALPYRVHRVLTDNGIV